MKKLSVLFVILTLAGVYPVFGQENVEELLIENALRHDFGNQQLMVYTFDSDSTETAKLTDRTQEWLERLSEIEGILFIINDKVSDYATLSKIDVSSIHEITILKDPESLSKYGEGIQGVVLIKMDEPFFVTEQMPIFLNDEEPGDLRAFNNWVLENIRYPAVAQENGIEGRVVVGFVVEKNGKITDINVVQSPHQSLSDEAVRVVSESPDWIPGMQRGKPVRVKMTMPISFRLVQ